ncbi:MULTISPECIES: hypothetical protein [Nocardia]|uniref:hypothetical protein n=1 Tax=Nocardia TaxID=1817 RepID=UPI000A011E69|nr:MULTISPECIES: hypothetical protein [Nocardia]MBF6099322.1 hypothetical protein [Nocardia cyriacigeorgica]
MSKTGRPNYRRGDREVKRRNRGERRIYLRTVRRDPPDIELLSKALIALALAETNKSEMKDRKSASDETNGNKEAGHDNE